MNINELTSLYDALFFWAHPIVIWITGFVVAYFSGKLFRKVAQQKPLSAWRAFGVILLGIGVGAGSAGIATLKGWILLVSGLPG